MNLRLVEISEIVVAIFGVKWQTFRPIYPRFSNPRPCQREALVFFLDLLRIPARSFTQGACVSRWIFRAWFLLQLYNWVWPHNTDLTIYLTLSLREAPPAHLRRNFVTELWMIIDCDLSRGARESIFRWICAPKFKCRSAPAVSFRFQICFRVKVKQSHLDMFML